jgi:adenylate cyclase
MITEARDGLGLESASRRGSATPSAAHRGERRLNLRLVIRIAISAVLFLVFALHVPGYLPMPFLDRLEDMAYDSRVRTTMPGTVDPRVVIVDLDERSITAEGRWPWARDKVATLVEKLFDQYGVRVVGFDMNFPEADDQRAVELLEDLAARGLKDDPEFAATYAEVRPALDTDRRFAEALAGRPVVMGYVFHPKRSAGEGQRIGALPAPLFAKGKDGTNLRYEEAAGYTGNLAPLQQAAPAGGFFTNPLVDADGSFRRVPLLQTYEGAVYESLALATLRVALGGPPLEFVFASGPSSQKDNLDLEWVMLGDQRIPVDEQLGVWVPYRGHQLSFPYVSATDVLRGAADFAVLRDAIVLVGTSAPGLLDLRNTPVGEAFTGVEVHANIISGVLEQRVKHHPEYVRGIHIMMLLFSAIVLTLIQVRFGVVWATATTVAFLVLGVAANLVFWEGGNFILPMASPIVFVLLLFFVHTLYGFFIESRGARQLAAQFGQYVPPELVEEMAQHGGEKFTFEGQTREMTVLFSDVRGFTTISEGLGPKELSELMNAYLTPMTGVIHKRRGTIDKYIGDAIMAFWGAPLPDPDHAKHAVLAGMEMEKAAEAISAEFQRKGWPPIHIGVGLSSGPMRVGDMGSRFRKQYTVMGDVVNLGSRLEGLTKNYGITVLASDATRDKVPEVQFIEIDRVRVKGKEHPAAIFTPVGMRDALEKGVKHMAARHKTALALYREQRWDDAEKEFFSLYQEHKKHYHQVYLDRINHFRREPPPAQWDGVFTYTTK